MPGGCLRFQPSTACQPPENGNFTQLTNDRYLVFSPTFVTIGRSSRYGILTWGRCPSQETPNIPLEHIPDIPKLSNVKTPLISTGGWEAIFQKYVGKFVEILWKFLRLPKVFPKKPRQQSGVIIFPTQTLHFE